MGISGARPHGDFRRPNRLDGRAVRMAGRDGMTHHLNRPEILHGCANARQLARICDLLDGTPGVHELSWDLSRGSHHIAFQILADPSMLAVLIEDPDLRPYVWDLPEEC